MIKLTSDEDLIEKLKKARNLEDLSPELREVMRRFLTRQVTDPRKLKELSQRAERASISELVMELPDGDKLLFEREDLHADAEKKERNPSRDILWDKKLPSAPRFQVAHYTDTNKGQIASFGGSNHFLTLRNEQAVQELINALQELKKRMLERSGVPWWARSRRSNTSSTDTIKEDLEEFGDEEKEQNTRSEGIRTDFRDFILNRGPFGRSRFPYKYR